MIRATTLVGLFITATALAKGVSFDAPKDGATVKSPVAVKMKVEGMKIRPAGEDANDTTSGHHHLLIDAGPAPEHQVIAADATHLHFGKGQTETEVKLPPGDHTLTLQFADGAHRSYGPAMSKTITVHVIEAKKK
jgi:hypothetical protein